MSTDVGRTIATARYIAALLVSLNCGAQKPEKPDGVSYRAVFSLAKRHSIAGALWYILEDEIVATGDTELIARFTKACDLDYIKHTHQAREFASVTKAFSTAGVKFLPVKGFANKALWLRPEYRTMSDMDIYVSESGLERAAEVLLSLGYQLDHGGSVHDSYMKPPYVNIELHKTLGKYGAGDFSLWKPREDDPFFHEMSDEDFLVYVIDHMYKHYKTGGSGMRSFFDVYIFLSKNGDELDKEYILRDRQARGLDEFYALTLRLCERWFGEGKSGEELVELEYYIVTGGTYGTVENKVEEAMKTKSGFRYTLSRAFLPYSNMKQIYKWLKPLPFLLPFAWVLRLLTALFDGRMRREVRATKAAARKKKNS